MQFLDMNRLQLLFVFCPCYVQIRLCSHSHASVCVVRSINRNGQDVYVDFTEQRNWMGLIGTNPRY